MVGESVVPPGFRAPLYLIPSTRTMTDMQSVGGTASGARTNGETAPLLVSRMNRLADLLARDVRLVNETVSRPHPLLVAVTRDDLMVVLAPAPVWDRGRELLKPF